MHTRVSLSLIGGAALASVRTGALALVTTLVSPLPSWSQEVRCTDLGKPICRCSEPLNAPDKIISNVHDPSDSPDAWECAQINGAPSGDKANAQGAIIDGGVLSQEGSAFVSGSSAGLPHVANVFQTTQPSGSSNFLDLDRDFTDATLCERYYIQFSDEWYDGVPGSEWPIGPNSDIKEFRQYQADGGPGDPGRNLQSHWERDGLYIDHGQGDVFRAPSSEGGYGCSFKGSDPIPPYDFADCRETSGGWCRIEKCWDHNSRSGADADKLLFRFRVTTLHDGVTHTAPSCLSQLGNAVARQGMHKNWRNGIPGWLGSGECPTKDAKNGGCSDAVPFPPGNPKMWYSHTLIAVMKGTDKGTTTRGGVVLPSNREDFWIGAALEIETDVPGGEVPAAPQPPVLLP